MKYDGRFYQMEKIEQKSHDTPESQNKHIVLEGVNEYIEGMHVSIRVTDGTYMGARTEKKDRPGFGREVIFALNEGGYNSTEVDLEQLLEWVAENRPEQYARFITESILRDYI